MSKMDGLRQMREARYERSLTKATLRGEASPASARRPATATRADRPADAPATGERSAPVTSRAKQTSAGSAASAEELCGHRAISGRTCTRERGHSAKSHRYS